MPYVDSTRPSITTSGEVVDEPLSRPDWLISTAAWLGPAAANDLAPWPAALSQTRCTIIAIISCSTAIDSERDGEGTISRSLVSAEVGVDDDDDEDGEDGEDDGVGDDEDLPLDWPDEQDDFEEFDEEDFDDDFDDDFEEEIEEDEFKESEEEFGFSHGESGEEE